MHFNDKTTLTIAVLLIGLLTSSAALMVVSADADTEPEYDEDLGVFYTYSVQFIFSGEDAETITWDFGDTSTSSDWNPRHTYDEIGVFYVTQTLTNSFEGGSESTAIYKLEIAGHPWIDFESNGGSDVETIRQTAYGVTAEAPEHPVRAGYTFLGWFVDEDAEDLFDWTTTITAPLTLFAGWGLISNGSDDTPGGDTTGEGTTWENIIDDVVDSLNDINDRLGIDHEFTVTEVAVIAGLIIAAIAGLIIAVTRFT